MSQARNVGAAFASATQRTLTVTGGAGGVVTSLPGGIDCGTRCVAGFEAGAGVSLVVRTRPGYAFAGWGGACSGTQTCDLTLASNAAVTASFVAVPAGQYAVTVRDFGEGTVQSSPAGVSCGTTCSAAFPANSKVVLLATPKPGYTFVGWTGACAGSGACTIYLDDMANLSAYFAPLPGGGGAPPGTEPIPTLSDWALVLLAAMLGALAWPRLRVRKARR
jgi:uncharacterized repeat protein (TIGR02543 family)